MRGIRLSLFNFLFPCPQLKARHKGPTATDADQDLEMAVPVRGGLRRARHRYRGQVQLYKSNFLFKLLFIFQSGRNLLTKVRCRSGCGVLEEKRML